MRNECYCQLVKQTNENPSEESTTRGWELFCACLATFPPGETLASHLGWYFGQNLGTQDIAEFCLRKLPKIRALGARREMPTLVEIQSCVRRDPALVRVFFVDGKFLTVPVDSWTTAVDCADTIARSLKMETKRPFALFEVSPADDEERVLGDQERVLDLVAHWHHLKKKSDDFRLVYKVRYFFKVPHTDAAAVELTYLQARQDVVDERYPCSDQDAVTLAALQVQDEYGDKKDGFTALKDLAAYLPKKVLDEQDHEALQAQLLTFYAKLDGYSQNDARLSYLDYVKSWKIYGSTFFFAEPKQNRDFPAEVVLAINAKGILVVDPASHDFLQEFLYSNIL